MRTFFLSQETASITPKRQPEEGERDWLAVPLEKCLGALSILQNKPGAQPSGTFSCQQAAN
ncbi:MAG: hypothetical protein HFH33_14005 [Eubacterium sp.]|nr:hypothetical protein [Eubacterium sp.]